MLSINIKKIFEKNKNIAYKTSIFVIIVISFIIIGRRIYHRTVFSASEYQGEVYNENLIEESQRWDLETGVIYQQEIEVDRNGLSNILLLIDNIKLKENQYITVQLTSEDNNEIIDEWEKINEDIIEGGYTEFPLSEPLIGENGNKFIINVYINSNNNTSFSNYDVINIDGHLQYSLQATHYKFMEIYYVIGIVIFIICVSGIIGLTIFLKKLSWQNMVIPVVLVCGIAYMIIFPPFTAPDEYSHFVASYQLSEKMLGKDLPNSENQVAQDVFLGDGYFTRYSTLKSYKYVWDALHESMGSDNSSEYINNLFDYVGAPGHFVPAIGIVIAKILDLPYIYMVYLGRFFNLLIWSVICYMIIRITPVGKMIFFVISCLPMTLELAASFSRDIYILELVYVFIAYILYLTLVKAKIKIINVIFLSLLLILLLPCKYIYVIIGFLVFIIPLKKVKNKKLFYGLIITTIILLCVEFFVCMSIEKEKQLNPLNDVTTEAVVGENVEFYSGVDILSNPIKIVDIFVDTLWENLGFYLTTMIGSQLGSLEILLPDFFVFCFYLLLILACIQKNTNSVYIDSYRRKILIGIFGMAFLSILAAMLIGWTSSTSGIIEGIQGRYFLPVIPLLCMTIQRKNFEINMNLTKIIIIGEVALHYFASLSCFEKIVLSH